MANTITVTYEVADGALTSRILGNSTPVISFTIDGNTTDISSQTKYYEYTFPAAGTYTIDFTLQDNLTDLSYLFSNCECIKTIWFDCDTSNVVNMKFLLAYCNKLEDVNANMLDVSNVTNMDTMFYDCHSLITLDVSNWNTSNVTNMHSVFGVCYGLTTLNLSNWDTSSVTHMDGMFYGCGALQSLDLNTWDTSNVTDISLMFYDCHSLITLDVSNWDTSKVSDMESVFCYCAALTTLNVATWDTSSVTNMSAMFRYCKNIKSLNLSNWNTSNVTNISLMFFQCLGLNTLDVSTWNTSKVTDLSSTFFECSDLTTLDVSNWDTRNVTNMKDVFGRCVNLTSLNVANWDTSNVVSLWGIFNVCTSLTSLDVSNWDTSNVEDMAAVFFTCESLTSLDLSNWDTSNVVRTNQMFEKCYNLTNLNISNWDTSKIYDTKKMFQGCESLTSLDLSNWNTSNVKYVEAMFMGCESLTTLDVSTWDTSNIVKMTQMFQECKALTTLDVSNWDTSSVTHMNYVFAYSGIICIDLSNWTFDARFVDHMFDGISAKKIILGEINKLGYEMFCDCENLEEIYCDSIQSPVSDNRSFSGNIKTGGTLYCPSGAVGYETNWATLIEDYGWNLVVLGPDGNAIAICEDIIFEDDADKVEYRIYADDNLIYSGYAYRYPNEEGMLEIELNDILSDYLKNHISFTEGLQEMEGYLRKFRIQSSNASKEVDVYNGWEKAKSAILNDPISNEIDPRQHLFINYIDGYNDLSVYRDGESLGALGKICGGVYIVPRTDATCGGKVSYDIKKGENKVVASQNYTYKGTNKNYALYYVNAYGGWDSLAIRGNVTQTDNMQSQTYKNKTNGKVKYLNTITPTWQLYTDDMNDGSKMHHLLESTEVYLHNLETDEIVPVVITDSNCVYKTYANQGNTRFHYTINVEASNYKIRK